MVIPKKIHYCWFGGQPKPKKIVDCLESWSILNDYEIIEWNEENFDINCNDYVKQAYDNKKYAFVSDYARLKVLYDHGGIYFDTDVEVKKDLEPFLENNLFLGFMYDSLLGTAVIGACKNNTIIKELLDKYNTIKLEYIPNNNMFTEYFLKNYPSFKLNNEYQKVEEGVSIYPKEYFERPTYKKSIHFCEHHYTATWKDEKKSIIRNIAKAVLPNVVYRDITHKRVLKHTPFYDVYLEHNKK
ncbi:mannosyltransferase [Clostridium sp. NSJ-145]|uniref:glycosyltransferase family 32 protein n=1 Tax=Clostridium sp. NSJ-145 TaxID=2897777 RepID=UPI001E571A2D|nr:glycosyltransferase [Clostridium sp. NSJ-145]MCD2502365.1 mannosyltransferase [Clostridium sp. NSJ-145]